MRTVPLFATALLALVAGAACTGENAKDATAAVVGKGIEVSKGTVTGIAAGIEQGRKQGESADGALSSHEELMANGGATLGAIEAAGEGSSVSILVENKSDKPMRATKLSVIVLDKDGVVSENHPGFIPELTVPPHAKAKLTVSNALAPDKVGTVRLYNQDVPR